jgi:uncharacterized protein YndB with AHSA1/START domain
MNSATQSKAQAKAQAKTQVKAQVVHRFNASPEAVFDAWITGDKIRQWFAPGLGEMVRIAVDAREGGMFSFVQRRGMEDVDHQGRYLEFQRPDRLAFSWQVKGTADSSRVMIDIAPTAVGSELTLVHELHPHWADYRERMQASWSKMLTAMAAAIE